MEKTISNFVEDVVEEHLKVYRNENADMQKIRKRAYEISVIMQMRINRLEDQELEMLMEYESLRNEEEGLNYSHLYLAGMKDCIRLLKKLSVL